jgi:nucleoid DNA-binding protein
VAKASKKASKAAASNGRNNDRKKSMSKSELFGAISEETELSRGDVRAVFQSLEKQIERSLSRKGPGVFTLPGICKIEKKKVPARKARKNVPNPFKPGEFMDVAAKPASTKIKVRPLRNLKTMA